MNYRFNIIPQTPVRLTELQKQQYLGQEIACQQQISWPDFFFQKNNHIFDMPSEKMIFLSTL